MADEDKNDAYQYPPEEYYKSGETLPDEIEDEDTAGPPTRRPVFSRRLFYILGFLIAIGLVYLILTYMAVQRNSDVSQPTLPPVAPVVVAPPSAPVVAAQPASLATPTVDPRVTDALQSLANQNQANQQAIANLQAQVQQLQSQISGVTTSLSTQNSQMQVIVNELRAIAIERAIMGRSMDVRRSGAAYHIKAIVAGRAWLQTSSGATTTVTLGDRLPRYGIVQGIDPDQGIVTTSSGVIIEYGSKDS